MLSRIKVYGRLARFLGQRTFEAEVHTPIDSIKFLLANFSELERHMVELGDEIRPIALQYVNRLSDWLFVLARWITHCLGESEVLWVPKGQRAISGESPKDIQESLEKDFDEL